MTNKNCLEEYSGATAGTMIVADAKMQITASEMLEQRISLSWQ